MWADRLVGEMSGMVGASWGAGAVGYAYRSSTSSFIRLRT